MIALIRINLLPDRDTKRSAAGGSVFVAIWVALVLGAVAVTYLWYASVDEERRALIAEVGRLQAEVQGLTAVRDQMTQREEQQLLLARQNAIFDNLRHGKTGPALATAYLAYVLTDREDNLYNVDELRAREDAGWDIDWDPSRLWVTSLTQTDTELTLEGEGLDHGDVTEFHRRLESSNFFYDVRLGVQQVKTDDTIGARFVEFKLTARVNYHPDGIPMPASVAAEARAGAPGAAGPPPTGRTE